MATKYYAVKVGRTTGIFETWDQCKASVNGYPGALYKSFKTKTEAYNYMGWNGEHVWHGNGSPFWTLLFCA